MKTWLLVIKALLSPWLLLTGLVFFRALGFAVTTKQFVALAYFCLFWSMVIAAYLSILSFVKNAKAEEKRGGKVRFSRPAARSAREPGAERPGR